MNSRATIIGVFGAAAAAAVAAALSTAAVVAAPSAPLAPTLPSAPGRFAPAHTSAAVELRGAALADTDACEGCHVDIAAQWRQSAHSFASFNNPIYRVVVEKFRAEVGLAASRFCGGCHDPALLVDGALDGPAPVAATDPRAHAGVNCRTCHGISAAHADGQAAYELTRLDLGSPRMDDPASLRAHGRAARAPALDDPMLCGACHRAFLHPPTGNPAFLVGQDDVTPWARSAYAGSRLERLDEPVAPATCQSCHMPLEAAPRDPAAKDGLMRSHRFAGAHSWMAAMRGHPEQAAAQRAALAGAISADVLLSTTSTADRPVFDVVLRNERVGHRFPGGVMDAQDTWIEVTVLDAAGRALAGAGLAHADTGADPTAHVLTSAPVDEDGHIRRERETHRFRAVVWNHTLAPRDAAVVQYPLALPAADAAALTSLTVRARLRHRTRNLALQALTCAETRSPRGRAFDREARALVGVVVDPCAPQPITDVAFAEVHFVRERGTTGSTGGAATWRPLVAPSARRHWVHGLGLAAHLSERLPEASAAFSAALTAAASPFDAALALAGLGQVAARQGRVDAALAYLDRAATLLALLDRDPAAAAPLLYMRGEALAQVWRWSAAAPLLQAAAELAPLDDAAWSRAATAWLSASDPARAAAAAARGLAAQPRSSDLLRIQSVALHDLGAPDPAADAAFVDYRAPDRAPGHRAACSKRDPACARERRPVHEHPLVPLDTSQPRR